MKTVTGEFGNHTNMDKNYNNDEKEEEKLVCTNDSVTKYLNYSQKILEVLYRFT